MKKTIILLSIIFLTALSIVAQESVNNFIPENNKIVWQKVFETNLDKAQLLDIIKVSGVFENYDIEDDKISGQINPVDADFKGAGFSEMSTPIYIARSFFDGYLIIEFKENRYRVTLKNIMLIQQYDDGLSKAGEKTTIETYAIKNGQNELKKAFTKSPSVILDYTFTNIFNFKLTENNDNW